MRKPIVYAACAAMAMCMAVGFLNCGSKGGNPVGGGGATQTMTFPGTYRVSGDSIFVTVSMAPDTYSYCNGDSLVSQIDTMSGMDESGMRYTLSGNTLTLAENAAGLLSDSSSSAYSVDENLVYSRSGSESGLQGKWFLASVGFNVTSGILPDSLRNYLDSITTSANQEIVSGQISESITLSGNSFSEAMTVESKPADQFVSSWTECSLYAYSLDTCNYAVTVVNVNDYTAQLRGKKTGETVTIVWNANNDQTYTSSNTSHAAYTYIENPKTCPDDYEPGWFITFLSDNSNTAVSPLGKMKSCSRSAMNHSVKRTIKMFFLR